MADYISMDAFNKGWSFYVKQITDGSEKKYGLFRCYQFECTGCDDWLSINYENRNVNYFNPL